MSNASQIADLATRCNFSVLEMCTKSAPRQRQLEDGMLFTLNDGSMILWTTDDDWTILTAVRVDSQNENLVDADGNVRFVRDQWNALVEVMPLEDIEAGIEQCESDEDLLVLQDQLDPHILCAASLDALFSILRLQAKMIQAAESNDGRQALGEAFANIVCDLPVFSTNEPSDTIGIWSYDDDRAIVGEGWGSWGMIPRWDLTVEVVRVDNDDDGNIVINVPQWGLSFSFNAEGQCVNGVEFCKWFQDEGAEVAEWALEATTGETEDFFIAHAS